VFINRNKQQTKVMYRGPHELLLRPAGDMFVTSDLD